jgi:mono/diheme cytochrome c family protein
MMLRGLVAGCIIGLPGALQAQSAAEEPRTTRSGIYTAAQATRGSELYALNCSSCHSAATHASPAFAAKWAGHPLAELFQYMNQEMPKENPGSLSAKEYTLVLAYLLKMNGMPAGRSELSSDPVELEKIRIDLKPMRDSSSRQP